MPAQGVRSLRQEAFSWFTPSWEVKIMAERRLRWRTVDIVVAAVLAVAFGAVFQVWNIVWQGGEGPFAFYKPAEALIYGVWLIPAVLAGYVLRKPGAAVFTETLAAAFSVLIGSPYGLPVIWQGAVEGFGSELAFLGTRYRVYRPWVAALSGALGGLAATLYDAFAYFPQTSWLTFRLPYIALGTLSCLAIAG